MVAPPRGGARAQVGAPQVAGVVRVRQRPRRPRAVGVEVVHPDAPLLEPPRQVARRDGVAGVAGEDRAPLHPARVALAQRALPLPAKHLPRAREERRVRDPVHAGRGVLVVGERDAAVDDHPEPGPEGAEAVVRVLEVGEEGRVEAPDRPQHGALEVRAGEDDPLHVADPRVLPDVHLLAPDLLAVPRARGHVGPGVEEPAGGAPQAAADDARALVGVRGRPQPLEPVVLGDHQVVVEEDDVGVGVGGREPLVDPGDEAEVLLVADDRRVGQALEEVEGPVRAAVVDDDEAMAPPARGERLEEGRGVGDGVPREDDDRHRRRHAWASPGRHRPSPRARLLASSASTRAASRSRSRRCRSSCGPS